jgi:hypothetical protein
VRVRELDGGPVREQRRALAGRGRRGAPVVVHLEEQDDVAERVLPARESPRADVAGGALRIRRG